MKRLLLVPLFLFATACSGSNESASDTFDELGVSAPASKPEVMRGKLRRGDEGGLAISEGRGPEDHVVVALDLSRTAIAGHDDALLAAAGDADLYVRGKIERRDVGELPNGTRVQRDVLVAEIVGEILSRETSATGILRREDGDHIIEKQVGSGNDTDDAGSIKADFGEVSIALGGLVGKKVRARGTTLRAYEAEVRGSLIARERIVVRSLARSR